MRITFQSLALHAKKHTKKNYAWSLATIRSDQRLKHRAFYALASRRAEKNRLNTIGGTVEQAFNQLRLRKVMLALRDYTTKSYKGRMVAAKWGMRIKDKFLARWQEQMFVAQKLNRMCSIMQEQNYLTFIRAFMLKLEDAGEYMQLRKKLNMKLKAKAWQIFKQDWLLGRMAKSLH